MIYTGLGLLAVAAILAIDASGAHWRRTPRYWLPLLGVAFVLAVLGLLALGVGYIRA